MNVNRATLEKVAAGYHEIVELQAKQHVVMAEMIRACIAQLKSPVPSKRREAIKGLEGMAVLLESKGEVT